MVELWERRNPLESGQCFSLTWKTDEVLVLEKTSCRNPLESGQCFSRSSILKLKHNKVNGRNPLESGQCFSQGILKEKGLLTKA